MTSRAFRPVKILAALGLRLGVDFDTTQSQSHPACTVSFSSHRHHNVLLAVGHISHRAAGCAHRQINLCNQFAVGLVISPKLCCTADSGTTHYGIAAVGE